jgi:hypothetical protein
MPAALTAQCPREIMRVKCQAGPSPLRRPQLDGRTPLEYLHHVRHPFFRDYVTLEPELSPMSQEVIRPL